MKLKILQLWFQALGSRGVAVSRFKRTLLGTPNRDPQEYSGNILEYKDPGRYIPTIFLGFPVWGRH